MLNRQPQIPTGRFPRHGRCVPGTETLLVRAHEIPAVVIRQVVDPEQSGLCPR